MYNSEKPVTLFIGKKNLCDVEKAFLSLLKFQTEIGGESALVNPKIVTGSAILSNVIAIGSEANLEAASLNRIAVISSDPYLRYSGESYYDWLERVDDLHGAICNCYKIIATTREAYLSLILKHQQSVYYVPFPPTVKIKVMSDERDNKFGVIKSKNSKIPNELIGYFKKVKKDFIEFNYDQNSDLTTEELSEILKFKELFWVGDLNLKYEKIDINPISLSMSSKIVHVNDLSSFGSVTGFTFNECVRNRSARTPSIKTSLAQQMGKQYLVHPNYSVVPGLKDHLI